MKYAPHLVMFNTSTGSYVAGCLNCGQRYVPVLPISLVKFNKGIKAFGKTHKQCTPGPNSVTLEEMKKV